MDGSTFLVVLAAAACHAGWNAVLKGVTAPKIGTLWVGQLACGLATAPWVLSEALRVSSEGWCCLLATGAIHAVYICLLGAALSRGPISHVYPLMRGVGVAGTAVVATAMGIDELNAVGVAGVLLIGVGTLGMGVRGGLFALGTGMCIAAYSVVDKVGATHVSPFAYVAIMNVLSPLFAAPYVLGVRKGDIVEVLATHKRLSIGVGAAGLGTYALIVLAFSRSPASYVVALRESSIVFAAAIGIVCFRERLTPRRGLGILAIVAGAALIRFV